MAKESHNDKEPKGFAGLNSLTSDISKEIENLLEEADQPPKPTPPKTASSTDKRQHRKRESPPESSSDISSRTLCSDGRCIGVIADDGRCTECGKHSSEVEEDAESSASQTPPPSDTGGSSGLKWLFGLGCLFFVIWLISSAGDEDNSTPSRSKSTYTPYSYSPQQSNKSSPSSKMSPTVSTDSFKEVKPPVGQSHILNSDQIRYCLSENIRLESMDGFIDIYSDAEVDNYNAAVDDYNSRCANFRYSELLFAGVQRSVEQARSRLVKAGQNRVAAWRKPLIRAIQSTLAGLGYNPGPADGIMGRRTTAAIKSFQRVEGLKIDGKVSQVLLSQTQEAKDNGRFVQPVKQEESECGEGFKSVWKNKDGKLWNECVPIVRTDSNIPPSSTSKVSTNVISPPSSTNKELSVGISSYEMASIKDVCDVKRRVSGPAAYNDCLEQKISELQRSNRNVDFSGYSQSDIASIKDVCDVKRRVSGPGAYNDCLEQKVSELRRSSRYIDFSGFTQSEIASIKDVCDVKRRVSGPGAYNDCLEQKVSELRRSNRNVDFSGFTQSEITLIKDVCDVKRRVSGPAAYNDCLVQKVSELRRSNRYVDFSGLSYADIASIKDVCDVKRRVSGPGAYYDCLASQVAKLKR